MKRSLIAVLLIAPAVLCAQEPTAPNVAAQTVRAPHAWLGFRVAKPDPTITAQVPALPPGIGFLVISLDPGGPGESAGLQSLDLIWKLDDQMLVNESQLAALLRLSKPGEEVKLCGFRGGKPLEVKVKLGEAPLLKRPYPRELVEASILPGDGSVPMRIVNVAEKSATYSNDEGKAVVQREGDLDKVSITGTEGKMIFEGSFLPDDQLEKVPEEWRRKISALRRGLDQSLDGRMLQPRQPRPRVVPPPAGTP